MAHAAGESNVVVVEGDTTTTARKGRSRISGNAMTPAARKRRQREKAKDAKSSNPQWLRLRQELFGYIFNRYAFNNVDELASALRAVSCALTVANSQSQNCPTMAKEALVAIVNPDIWKHGTFLPELLQYTPDTVVVSEGFQNRKLAELYCDIFDCHGNDKVHR